jgi:hypothetical protein
MQLPENVTCQVFDIWAPRWHDRKVLLAVHRVGRHNLIRFTKAPTLIGEFYVSGSDIFQCDRETNGTIDCYAVPLNILEPLERQPRSAKQMELFK